jgi:Glyoxalase-like domain
LRIDHAVLAVADLDEAGDRLFERTGLEFLRGGVHPTWGTANRIAPLGEDYVELISVTDPAVGGTNVLGRTLLDLTRDGHDRWFSICLRDDAIEVTAARLGLTVEAGSRMRPDGVELRWRGAGIEDPKRASWLPFFIAWDVPADQHPGRAPAHHRIHPAGISRAEIGGDPGVMRAWVGGAELPLVVTDDGAPPGVRSVTIALEGRGELVL